MNGEQYTFLKSVNSEIRKSLSEYFNDDKINTVIIF